MKLYPQIQEMMIVLRGSFNPAIFQPAWFAINGLIRQQEAEAAEVRLIHPEAAAFRMEWLEFSITRDRLQASTIQEAYFEPTRDLVLGLLELLNHTPITLVGLNGQFHYRAPSEAYWHRIGHRLAPKHDWEAILPQPGLRSLTIEGRRADGRMGYLRATVEPSVKVQPGIYINVNDHYQLDESSSRTATGTVQAREVLMGAWAASVTRAGQIAQHIAELGETA